MADTNTSIASLFGGIGSDEALKAATRAQDQAFGQALSQAEAGRAGLLYAPQEVTAVGRAGRLFAGQDTRTKAEIEAASNREMFQQISQQAQNMFPTDRTKQLNYLADELNRRGKVAESQKARALAQESALTQAQIGKETALGTKALAQADEARGKTAIQGLGDVKPEDFTPTSWQAYINSGDSALTRNAALLKSKPGADLTSYQKILQQAYPNNPQKQMELAQEYAQNYAASAGGDVNPDKVYAEVVAGINAEAIAPYRSEAQEADMSAEQIDSLIGLSDSAITGAGSSMKQFLISIGRQAGFSLENLGSLTDTQLISRVLSKEVLKKAGNLKGALSDKDLAFLKETVGDLSQSPQALRAALMELKNTKLRAKYVNDKYNDTIRTNKKALTSDVLNINGWANEATTELQLVNPQLVAATFMMSNGQPNPDVIAGLKSGQLTIDDVVSPDDSDVAVQALIDALNK